MRYGIDGCARTYRYMQAYREKTAELQKLEQDVIREAVVSSEIDVFLDEVCLATISGSAGVDDTGGIHSWQQSGFGY